MCEKMPEVKGDKTMGSTKDLRLSEFQPQSMLRVTETHIERPRFPAIDFHTHISLSPGLSESAPVGGQPKLLCSPERALGVMDAVGIDLLVDLTGGFGTCLDRTLSYFVAGHASRFAVFTEPSWYKVGELGYPQFQADEIVRAKRAGARGLKILKTLGFWLRERVTEGPLITIDDKRFDPMWETAGALGMPVLIHSSDPVAFFLPADRFNERYEELRVHPELVVLQGLPYKQIFAGGTQQGHRKASEDPICSCPRRQRRGPWLGIRMDGQISKRFRRYFGPNWRAGASAARSPKVL